MGYYGTAKNRQDIAATGQGLLTESYPRITAQGNTQATDGTIYAMGVALKAGDVVSSAAIVVQASGTTMTLSKVGLYSKAGARLAISADQGTAWQSTGLKTIAFTAAYTVPTDDLYYAAFIAKGTATPTFQRANNAATLAVAINSGSLPFCGQTGQTDLIDPATFTSGPAVGYWIGLC